LKKNNLKLAVFTIVIVAATLACSTLTGGGDNTPNNQLPLPLPSNTPVPPPTDAAPTLAPEATENTAPQPTEAQQTGSMDVLFFDDFSDPNSGWDRFSNDEGLTDYDNGVYLIGIYQESWFYWANPYQFFGDVVVEVEAQKVTGEDDMSYGIVCRHQDVDNWYLLNVSADGFAAIRKRYQGSELTELTDWVAVPSLNMGNGVNLLRGECVGDRISLYVNGELAIETFDSDIVSGDVGLMGGTFNQSLSEVIFDNFTVYNPN